jgi:hypothetical protein
MNAKSKINLAALSLLAMGLAACQPNISENDPQLSPDHIQIEDSRMGEWSNAKANSLNTENLNSMTATLNHFTVKLEILNQLPIASVKAVNQFEPANPRELTDGKIEGSSVYYTELIDLSTQKQNQEFKIKYTITLTNGQTVEKTKTLRKDLVISDLFSTQQYGISTKDNANYFGKLWLMKGSVLRTSGDDIKIIAEEIISDGATIESFSEAETLIPSAQGFPGINGGNITVETDLIAGELTVNMRGAKGGRGLQGPARDSGDRPEKRTADGKNAELKYRTLGGVTGITNPRSPDARAAYSYCAQEPTNGQDATRVGFQGIKGGTGMPGGNSGTFNLKAKKVVQFNRTINLLPGLGGDPGPGGPGGMGEQGGLAGKQVSLDFGSFENQPMTTDKADIQNSWDSNTTPGLRANAKACTGKAEPGKDGPSGAPGPEGDTGRSGYQNSYCAPKGDSAEVECSHYTR